MHNQDDKIIDLDNIRMLSVINSEIILKNISPNLFSDLNNNFENKRQLSFILYLVNEIIDKTESSILIKINFKDDINLEKIKFKSLERIFFLFYSQATISKFIENKQFCVNFPQLQNKENNQLSEEEKQIFIIDLENNLINEDNKFGKREYDNFINKYPNNNFEIFLEENRKIEQCISLTSEDLPIFNFNTVALGGSFDHYHMGHNMLLNTAALLCKSKLMIGVTSDEILSKKSKSFLLQPFELRVLNVKMSLEKMGFEGELVIFKLEDGVGGAGTEENLEALIVTGETIKGGDYVNEVRKKNNLKELTIIVANLICTNESSSFKDKSKISSTFIRNKILEETSSEILENLESEWKELTQNILKLNKNISSKWFSLIRDYYMESWRKYHNLNHIFNYINIANKLIKEGKVKDSANVLLSIWFHDIIYTPSRPDNEDRSLQIFLKFYEEIKDNLKLENTLEKINIDKIGKYIIATKFHFSDLTYDDSDLNYLLDMDLITFGFEDFEKYKNITSKIEFEFSHHLTKEEWRLGRSKFLESVLNKKFIYRTEEFYIKFEEIARSNIKKEIENLK